MLLFKIAVSIRHSYTTRGRTYTYACMQPSLQQFLTGRYTGELELMGVVSIHCSPHITPLQLRYCLSLAITCERWRVAAHVQTDMFYTSLRNPVKVASNATPQFRQSFCQTGFQTKTSQTHDTRSSRPKVISSTTSCCGLCVTKLQRCLAGLPIVFASCLYER